MKNRNLFWFCISFVVVAAFWMIFENTTVFICAFSVWIVSAASVLAFKKAKIAAICVISAAAFSLLWQTFVFGTEEIPAELLKNSKGIVAEVTDYSGISKNGTSVAIKARFECEGKSINAIVYTQENIEQLAPGDIIRMDASFKEFENTESFASETYYKVRRTDIMAFAENVTVEKKSEGISFCYIPQYLAKQVEMKIEELFPEKSAAFLKSLLIGNKEELSDDFKESLKKTGLSHTVSVSGMHISFIVGFILYFTKNKYLKLLCIPVIFLFALMVGAPQSALRAVIMQAFVLVAAIRKREYDSFTAIAMAAFVLVMINPHCITDLAFILSFSSTLGIIILLGPISDFLIEKFGRKKPGRLKKFVNGFFITASLSVSATLFTTPISSYAYNSFSLISILSNILLIWLITIVFVYGFVSVILGFLFMPIAKGVAFVVNMCSNVAMSSALSLSKLPFAEVATEYPVVILLVTFLCIVAICAIAFGREKIRLRVSITAAVLAVISTFFVFEFSVQPPDHKGLRFDVLDVGQGQCVVVTAGESCVVIDCGGSEDAASIAGSHLFSNGIDNIDALVFTHAHSDHANGGSVLIDDVETKKVYIPDIDKDSSAFTSVRKSFDNDRIVFVKENMIVNAGEIEFRILTLPGGIDENENGVVIVVRDGEYECVITGDLPESGERYLLEKLPDCESYVVGHHGSKTSSSQELLNKILPELSVISVGENNSYGHPAAGTLMRLEKIGSNVARTDEEGTITFYSRQENENEHKH